MVGDHLLIKSISSALEKKYGNELGNIKLSMYYREYGRDCVIGIELEDGRMYEIQVESTNIQGIIKDIDNVLFEEMTDKLPYMDRKIRYGR